MAKSQTKYSCQECGHQSTQWIGRCPSCSKWNTFVEEFEQTASRKQGPSLRPNNGKQKPQKIPEINTTKQMRFSTGIGELDRVLGGGMVEGSYLLIGGEPGIGKSTLLLQSLSSLAKSADVLYITGEESVDQVKMRAERLSVSGENLYIASETCWSRIEEMCVELKPKILAIDSIQTMFMDEIQSAPGSVSQVREVGARLLHLAKNTNTVVILVGHVTKDGSIAGPRVLEHMVDTVLYFEAVAGQGYRVLRGIKNRFGSTNEIGVFDMASTGLREITNPSEMFLAERLKGSAGSVVVSSLEGSRTLLVELQALVTKSFLGNPRRTILGFDSNRASILLAVLEKKVGLELFDRDVFVNVVGGLELTDTSADLGFLMAVASSHRNLSINPDLFFVGEVGLGGEVRSVSRLEERIREAVRMGFRKCYVPKNNKEKLVGMSRELEVIAVANVDEAIRLAFD